MDQEHCFSSSRGSSISDDLDSVFDAFQYGLLTGDHSVSENEICMLGPEMKESDQNVNMGDMKLAAVAPCENFDTKISPNSFVTIDKTYCSPVVDKSEVFVFPKEKQKSANPVCTHTGKSSPGGLLRMSNNSPGLSVRQGRSFAVNSPLRQNLYENHTERERGEASYRQSVDPRSENIHNVSQRRNFCSGLEKLTFQASSVSFQQLLSQIPVCDGRCDIELFQFLLYTYTIYKLDIFPPNAILMGVLGKTKGELNKEFISLISVEKEWLNLCELLLDKFSSPMGYRALNEKFVMRTQNHQETPLEFTNSIEDSYRVFFNRMDENMVIEFILSGMNPQVRFDVFRYERPISLALLRKELSDYQRVQRSKTVYRTLHTQNIQFDQVKAKTGYSTGDSVASQRKPLQRSSESSVNTKEHRRQFGDFRSVNAFSASTGKYQNELRNDDLVFTSSGKQPVAVFATGSVCFTSCEISFDTCSSVSLIKRSFLKEIEKKKKFHRTLINFEGVGVNGTSVKLTERVNIPVYFQNKRVMMKCFIVDALCADILSGIDFLSFYECVVDIGNLQLRLNKISLAISIY